MSADEQLRLRFVELGAYGRLITSRVAADMGHHDRHVLDREVKGLRVHLSHGVAVDVAADSP